jgi:DNA polymerase-1
MSFNNKLFLLDAYALIFRAYYAMIKNPRINSKGMNTSAILGFVNTLEDVLKRENPTHIGIAFDPAGPTFRKEIYKEYKAQREETPEDIRKSVPIIKEIIKAYRIPILEVQGFEADDVIGTLSAQASDEEDIETYMLTPDKDYAQLVKQNVYMYRPRTGEKVSEILDVEKVKEKYLLKDPIQVIDLLGLMGDAADNIPGCPGVGEKTAQKLISEFGNIENLLDNIEKLKGALKLKVENNKEQIRLSKMLATIKLDVPIKLNLEELKREQPDEEKLKSIFDDLEFHNLTKRILGENLNTKKNVAQPSLFDNNIASSQTSIFSEIQADGQGEDKKTDYRSLETSNTKYQLVDNKDERSKLIKYLLTSNFLSLDTETTGTDPICAELVGMSFSIKENEAFYVSVSSNREETLNIVNEFKQVFENPNTLKIGQNIKYDILILKNYGIELKGNIFDTMVAHYVIQPELHHNMDYLAEIYLNYKTVHIEEIIGERGKKQKNMRDLSPTEVYKYACEDADITLQLKNKLVEELKKNNCEQLFYKLEMPLIPVLAKMESNGVLVDTGALKVLSTELNSKMVEIEKEIYQLAGTTFNIASPKQVGEVLFVKLKIVEKAKKTKTGQYVTSEEVLENLRHKHPVIEKILEYRGIKKLLSTYIDNLPALINPKTGRIHTSFNQTVTSTGRLSSSNPNLQNIPVRDEEGKEIRKAFIADEGCEFFSADYSQIELRIMAHLSGDQNMIEAFNHGFDIHAATAAKIYKIPIDEVNSDMRRKAKTANFGIIYGISAFGLAERLTIDRKEAKELIDNYFITFPQVRTYIDKSIADVREKGYAETMFHRKRFLPDINSHNAIVRGYAERNAVNAPIQGSAADIIKIAMARIYESFETEGLRSKMILQVHDELNFSVYPEEKERVEEIVIKEMEGACKMLVPLKADCGWGKNWLEAH